MLYPLKFEPILIERIWGGDALARYGKAILPGKRIGETWEISDRDDAQSVVANGPLQGQTLRQVMEKFGYEAIVGAPFRARPAGESRPEGRSHKTRFPLLIKMLDARECLSLQVHPPAAIATKLGGEPKTEMWYILDAAPDAHLMAGLKRGTTREQFTRTPAAFVHRFPVRAGDTVFIPSGRVHAIDAGVVLIEIQQNSDTTYRVHDWDRVGRQLHIAESLASIDFNDFEPSPTPLPIECEYFRVEKLHVTGKTNGRCDGSSFHVLAGIVGRLNINGEPLAVGDFVLVPATFGDYTLTGDAELLQVSVPPKTSRT